ncbi:MAG: PmoA family protein [Planctomycetes bacterium]|nr:PmoA family protein [Planctomycetota bacterium]
MRHLPFLASFAFAAATLGQSPAAPTPKPDPDEVRTANGTLVARLVREPHDPNAHLATSKVYHHVYAPDGRLLTKGLGGTFPHHRGLFVGWNKTTFGGTQHDFWHCGHGETQQFRGFASDEQKPGPRWHVA